MSDNSNANDLSQNCFQILPSIPSFSYPPPSLPNPYLYPYPVGPSSSYFPIPPPLPLHTAVNTSYKFYPPVSLPSHQSPLCSSQPKITCSRREKFTNDESTIEGSDYNLNKYFPNALKKSRIVPQVKLWEVSRQFKSLYRMLKDLENELDNLGDENTLLEEAKVREIVSKQEQLIACKNSINQDSLFLMCLKYKVNKRRKKRMYLKKKRKNKSHIHVNEIASEHMQYLEQKASQVKQEEKLKLEADNILSSVMHKKADAHYQIQLLQNLLKLHSARVHQLTVETNFTPDALVTGFEKVLEKLISLWEVKMREYKTEKNGLKLMIKDLAVNAEDAELEKLKNTFDEWLKLIFGTSEIHSGNFYYTYEQLLAIRQGWDKFVVDENDSKGSRIPGGWVIPKYNENESWNKFLFN